MTAMFPEQVQKLFHALRLRGQKIALAESCTGGLLASELTRLPGISEVFLGCVVCYSNQAKIDLLGVSSDDIQREGAVSLKVARQMCAGVRRSLKSDWAVAITGIAGPAGGSDKKPVGTVFIAVFGPSFEHAQVYQFAGGREEIQKASIREVLRILLRAID